MTDAGGTRRRPARRGTLITFLVLAVCGLLFTASAQLARTSGMERHPESLQQLVTQRSANVASLTGQVGSLDDQIRAITEVQNANEPQAPEDPATALMAGTGTVRGSGVEVTLTDAGTEQVPEGAVADDLVFHQQDIQAVMNALWRGGAEAMTIQGKRVTQTSAVRCVGNVLYLQGQIYSPPYKVAAIGDPKRLRSALDRDDAVMTYLEYVAAYGLGWQVVTLNDVEMPPAQGSARLQYASKITATSW